MAVLNPKLTAQLAKQIYGIVGRKASVEETMAVLKQNYAGILDLTENNVVHARTGGPGFIKTETAFGLMVYGGENAKGNAFIILRGTKILGDLLTDLNAMWSSTSANGYKVHDGFSQAFQSLKWQLDTFIAGFAARDIQEVHCIGHSLGGALATLCADYITAIAKKTTYLYTFGSPRVGLAPFAKNLSDRIEPVSDKQSEERLKRVFRVHHQTDIVACVPTWPYSHVPYESTKNNDYFQPSPGAVPFITWHSMDKYIETVDRKKWADLRGKRFESYDDNSIERWLKNGSKLALDVIELGWLERAIWYVLRKCMKYLKITIDFFNIGSSNFTIYDTVAYVFEKALSTADALVSTVPTLIMALINKICSLWSGETLKKLNNPAAFIREVFLKFQNRLYTHCRQAIDTVLKTEVS